VTGYVDTHCHLDFDLFDPDRDAIIERAENAGIIRILNPGVDIRSSLAALDLAEKYPGVYAAIGVHPNDALSWKSGTLQELSELAKHPKVVAIGEIGLDYYRDHAPRDLQLQIFKEQLRLAEDLELPVVIHNRDATGDLLRVLTDWRESLVNYTSPLVHAPGVLHSFSADLSSAHKVISLGFFIGFTGPVTYRKADELRNIAGSLPMERILTETDAPFLAPHPKRGARNEPSYVKYVAEQLAGVRGMTINALTEAVRVNAHTLFKW
jgi:TatD DNase family protein